jgi:hypothetical protein
MASKRDKGERAGIMRRTELGVGFAAGVIFAKGFAVGSGSAEQPWPR